MGRVHRHGDEPTVALTHVRDQLRQLLARSDALDEFLLAARIAHALDCAETRLAELAGRASGRGG
jgi:hypothetical protein